MTATKKRRAKRTRFSTRHMRIDLIARLHSFAIEQEVPLHEVLNEAVRLGLRRMERAKQKAKAERAA